VSASFYFHRSSAFSGHVSIAFETQFTSVLHPGSLVSSHNFLILFLYFINRSRPRRSLNNSDKLILLVYSIYADAIEAVKAHAALSAFTPELISLTICTFFKRFRDLFYSNLIQDVECYW
jgi:hypothetical protein